MEDFFRSGYAARRVYETRRGEDGGATLRLADCVVELGKVELDAYEKLVAWLSSRRTMRELGDEVRMDEQRLRRFAAKLAEAGLLCREEDAPASLSGREFHERCFSKVLPSWLDEAFSHPFWERMTSGRGSARLHTGFTLELYHYTRNAHRHMPLACAHTRDKAIKGMRARHFAEEWNHYHYFAKALRHLGIPDEAVASSVPLPMTLALSNFMRQAAREDVLAYSMCSAVLEGTTADRGAYTPYHDRVVELYGVPADAVKPIHDHLDLDVKYGHKDLYLEILEAVPDLSSARAARILDYGHMLVEHVWMWTDSIERYYDDEASPMPRRAFDAFLD